MNFAVSTHAFSLEAWKDRGCHWTVERSSLLFTKVSMGAIPKELGLLVVVGAVAKMDPRVRLHALNAALRPLPTIPCRR